MTAEHDNLPAENSSEQRILEERITSLEADAEFKRAVDSITDYPERARDELTKFIAEVQNINITSRLLIGRIDGGSGNSPLLGIIVFPENEISHEEERRIGDVSFKGAALLRISYPDYDHEFRVVRKSSTNDRAQIKDLGSASKWLTNDYGRLGRGVFIYDIK